MVYVIAVKVHKCSHVINPKGKAVAYLFKRYENRFELQMETVGVFRHPNQL
jgi:hypothetical protein